MTNSQTKRLDEANTYLLLTPIYIYDIGGNVLLQYKRDNKYLIISIGTHGALTSETWNGYKKHSYPLINKYCWNFKDKMIDIKKEEVK